ncbi:glycoside hydrolase family 5 protein [Alsobacter sp. SYSU BS001988]
MSGLDRRQALAGLAGAALAAAAGGRAYAGAPLFRRGASIHNMMNWARVDPADKDRFAFPPFSGKTYETPDAILVNLSKAGIDFIRLTVDPGPFLQFEGERRVALDAMLRAAVRRLLDHGFAVIVDFHPVSQVPAYAPELITKAIDGPLFLAYAQLMARTAGLLAEMRSPRLALELMNEPQYGWDGATAARWQAMLVTLHAKARAAAPLLPIVLSGARGGDKDGLLALDPAPFRGSDVWWTFHYYAPHVFTHQGVKGDQGEARYWRYLSNLPYPAGGGDRAAVLDRVARNVAEDTSLNVLQRGVALRGAKAAAAAYMDSGFDRRAVWRDFRAVADWASRHGVDPARILLGEFGVTRTYGPYRASDDAAREAWLTDVRVEAEANGFAWAIWAVTGYGGMALVETDDAVSFDPVQLRALGLRVSS